MIRMGTPPQDCKFSIPAIGMLAQGALGAQCNPTRHVHLGALGTTQLRTIQIPLLRIPRL